MISKNAGAIISQGSDSSSNEDVALDNDHTNYDGGNGYLSCSAGDAPNSCPITITLGDSYNFDKLWIHFWNNPDQESCSRYYYGFKLTLYDNDGNALKVVNHLATGTPSSATDWQGIVEVPLGRLVTGVNKIKIEGQRNSQNGGFHIVEVDNIDPSSTDYLGTLGGDCTPQ